ncbi:LAME_0H12156g1_1 [Lachancea meyersii CBS 8951]|uniref:LAME_0H12156g1_1 n=1 Tax=Lachancea meyersii CBS 8951 TaxID=1266667 RepID=A0A1G4KH10_9SACH|nr:LAME_0H12156g1_1 [Lachancea meyersii CBS 8951]
MGSCTPSICKVDANLQDFKSLAKPSNWVDLYLNESEKSKPANVGSTLSNYSNTIQLTNEEYICYQFSHEYSVLSLYPLGDTFAGRTLKVHLPERLFNMHHTFTIREVGAQLLMEMILGDGLYMMVSFPVNCILDKVTEIPGNWFVVMNPYDFSIRRPQYMQSVAQDYTIVFLEDGGLLGLKRSANERGEIDVAPILFNDNSYLQGLSKFFFSKQNASQDSNVVSCTLYRERYLITLTQSCRMKVWDLEKQAVTFERQLASDHKHINRMYETLGQFLSLFEDKLAVFLPFENGLFQVWDLRLDSNGGLLLKPGCIYPCNLSSSSIWSLVDMKLTRPLEALEQMNYMSIVVLWKSNCAMKLQILTFLQDSGDDYQWVEATNQLHMDLRGELNFVREGDTSRALMNLKSAYDSELFKQAENILSENQVLVSPESPHNNEYLLNLESVLKDLKKQNDEPSSLTLYQNDLLLVNSLSLYSHSLYKVGTSLECTFHSLNQEANPTDTLTSFMQIIDGFAATIPSQVLVDVSHCLIEAVTTSFPTQIPMKNMFSKLFSRHLDGQFQMSNLKKLLEDLNHIDVVTVLGSFIEKTLQKQELNHLLVDSLYPNALMNVAVLESTHQVILIQNSFICKILLIFAFLEFDYTTFYSQLETLLGLHYKQQLWIHLYQLDKNTLASEMFTRTSKFGNGHKITSYADWSSAQTVILKELYDMAISPNPLFIESFDAFVISGTRSLKKSELYLTTIQSKFYIHSNVAHEFMLGLAFFVCGMYERAFDFLQKHPYPDTLLKELPDNLYIPLQKDGHMWRDVIGSFKLPNKHAAYYFNLSRLFSVANSYEYALRCAKRSIKFSAELENNEETQDFKSAQLLQYLNILIVFSNFEEIMDVLRCSPEIISETVKTSYYSKMQKNVLHKDAFFSTLLKLCEKSEGLYLPTQDYNLIDKILCEELSVENWITFKKAYAFRLMNGQDRSAAEVLYGYITSGKDVDIKRKCFLLIINIMSGFTEEKDRWFLADSHLVKLDDLKSGLDRLEGN